MTPQTILIIEDERVQRENLKGYFSRRGYTIATADRGASGIDTVRAEQIDIVITDYKMPDITGLEVLRQIGDINARIPVIIMTAYGTIETAVEAMKEGAIDYVQKPINLEELEIVVKRALQHEQLVSENESLRRQLEERFSFSEIVSQSREMEEALNVAGRVAKTKATVLVRGESGTGKELFARAIHYTSERKEQPFVVVNCAALPETLIESELFGHEKGAFTGAVAPRIGRFEEAHEGTLFIDEVGDIPLPVQVKLLRVLQSGEVHPLGGSEEKLVDVRIIAATHRDLESMLADGSFREDLFYRLNVVTVTIPPLRERKSDIPVLVDHFLRVTGTKYGRTGLSISREALDLLMKYQFPGNVRELEHLIERALILCRTDIITTEDLPFTTQGLKSEGEATVDADGAALNEQLDALEKKIILTMLQRTEGNQRKAAELLKISERNLRYKLEKMKSK
jgi:DNA-binding NtrC family response regulator